MHFGLRGNNNYFYTVFHQKRLKSLKIQIFPFFVLIRQMKIHSVLVLKLSGVFLANCQAWVLVLVFVIVKSQVTALKPSPKKTRADAIIQNTPTNHTPTQKLFKDHMKDCGGLEPLQLLHSNHHQKGLKPLFTIHSQLKLDSSDLSLVFG